MNKKVIKVIEEDMNGGGIVQYLIKSDDDDSIFITVAKDDVIDEYHSVDSFEKNLRELVKDKLINVTIEEELEENGNKLLVLKIE